MQGLTSSPLASSAAEHVLCGEDSRDFFDKAGIELPNHLNTYSRRWASLLLVAISGAFASGPIALWPTLEPLLIAEGVWAGPYQQANLTSVFSIATGVAMISLLVSGVIYDAIGARGIGALGAFGTAIALVAMAASIKIPSLNGLLWIAYPAATIFGWANSMDSYAWLWLLPEDQNTVAAVTGAIQCLSDSFCLLAVILHNEYGIGLPLYFVGTAALSVIAGVVALLFIPSRADMDRIATAVIQYQAPKDAFTQSYGATDTVGVKEVIPKDSLASDSWSNVLYKSWLAVRDTAVVFFYIHPGVSCLFILYIVFQYMFTVYPTFEMYPLYVGLMGTVRADQLVNIFGGLYACISAASLVLFGKVVDHVGLVQAVAWLNIPILFNTILYAVPTMSAEIVAQVILAWIYNVYYVFIPRFTIIYGPPELFGTMYGALNAIQGAFQLILTRFGTWACRLVLLYLFHGNAGPAMPYLTTIDLWSLFAVVSSLTLLLWWWYFPLPRVGSTTMAHVMNASCDIGRRFTKSSDAEAADCKPLQKRPMTHQSGTMALPGACCSCFQGLIRRSESEGNSGSPC